MKTIEVQSSSKEYVRAAVAATRDDVLSGTPAFAFNTEQNDDGLTFTAGTWLSNEKSIELVDDRYQEAYIAQALVGPGTPNALATGTTYFMYVRVSMGAQVPVRLAGKVKVL